MSTHWRELRAGARIADSPSRKGQGDPKARLGLAAEDPVRAGLPRRHITEHHTEVQLLNFDPRTLGEYIPPDHHLIRDIPMDLIQALEAGSIHALENMLDSDLVSQENREWVNEEKEKLELEILSGASFNDPDRMEWAWRNLWKHLINNECRALAVDERCFAHPVDPYFWTTALATETFSSGLIVETPPYRPHGRVIISESDLQRLQKMYYRQGYCSVLPSAVGLEIDVEDISELYVHSLMGETESLQRTRPGAPEQINKEEYLIAVLEVVHKERVFKSRSQLGRLASDVYEKRNPDKRRPAIRSTDPIIEKVWVRLGLKDTPVSELRRIRDLDR